DTGSISGAQGGTANWDTTTNNWIFDFGFGTFQTFWPNFSNQSATFGGSAGVVTIIDGNSANGFFYMNTSGLTFNVTGYTVQGTDQQHLLSISSGGTVTTDPGVTATISAHLNSPGFTKTGAGTLIISGANDTFAASPNSAYYGTTTVNAGVLQFNSA